MVRGAALVPLGSLFDRDRSGDGFVGDELLHPVPAAVSPRKNSEIGLKKRGGEGILKKWFTFWGPGDRGSAARDASETGS